MRTKLLAPRPELKVPVAMDSLAAKVPHSPSGSSCASLLRWRYSQCKDCLPKPWSDRLRLICGYKIISIKVSCVMVCPKLEYIYTFFFSLFSPLFGQEVSCTGDGTSYPSYRASCHSLEVKPCLHSCLSASLVLLQKPGLKVERLCLCRTVCTVDINWCVLKCMHVGVYKCTLCVCMKTNAHVFFSFKSCSWNQNAINDFVSYHVPILLEIYNCSLCMHIYAKYKVHFIFAKTERLSHNFSCSSKPKIAYYAQSFDYAPVWLCSCS